MNSNKKSILPAQVRTAGEVINMPYHSTPGTKDNDWMLTVLLGQGEGGPFFYSSHTLELADCIRKMGRIHKSELDDSFGRNEALLLQVLAVLLEKERSDNHMPLSWTEVEQYLQRHLSENITLGCTAEHFHLSRSSFCHMVKKFSGLSFQQNLEKIRIEWACSLLKDTPLNISQVSERTGYTDPLYFSRVFHKNRGMSPREYKKKRDIPEIECGTPR